MEQWRMFNFGGMEYWVSNKGRIKGTRKILKQRLNQDGYFVVTLGTDKNRRVKFVHRIVGMVWIDGYQPGYEINHIDKNRTNNKVSNLEWMSHAENIAYSYDNISKAGQIRWSHENNPTSRYTEEDVQYIRSLYKQGLTIMEIVKKLFPNYDYQQRKKCWNGIKYICSGKTWR